MRKQLKRQMDDLVELLDRLTKNDVTEAIANINYLIQDLESTLKEVKKLR